MKPLELVGRIVDAHHIETKTELPVGKTERIILADDMPKSSKETKRKTAEVLARLKAFGMAGNRPFGVTSKVT